jgi:AP-1 complex subunit beta-1
LQILTAVVKLFLKKPDNNQGLVQKVLQEATADNDNPDIRDRAYVYWRLLSGDLDIAKNIILSEKPAITTTMTSLPPQLLEQLLTELSTLASVYHKPPETFVGQGRFGADAIQHAAIQEQLENAVENPIAAAAVVAANGGSQANAENLLDIDFDGAVPASSDLPPRSGTSGLEGLAGTPQRIASPVAGQQQGSSLDDMMGLFDAPTGAGGGMASNDLMNGFAGLDLGGQSQPPAPGTQLQGDRGKKTNEDLLGMF